MASVTVETALPGPAGPFQGLTNTVTPDKGAPSSSVATPESCTVTGLGTVTVLGPSAGELEPHPANATMDPSATQNVNDSIRSHCPSHGSSPGWIDSGDN